MKYLSNADSSVKGFQYILLHTLILQVHSLEFKILQTNELLRRIRKEEPRAEVEQPPLLLSPDGTTDRTESAARVRAVVGVKRKRMGCTLSITAQSHNTLQPVPVPCACAPNTCCIVCGGPGTLYVAEPDRSLHTVDERVAMLFPRQHHVRVFLHSKGRLANHCENISILR